MGLQEVMRQDMEIVSAVRLALADRIGQERFDLWFGADTRLTVGGDEVIVAVADQFSADWVRNHFRADIEAVGTDLLVQSPAVKFLVDPTLKQSSRSSADHRTETAKKVGSPTARVPSSDPAGNRHVAKRRYAQFDQYVVSEENQLAYTSSEMVVRRLGEVTPLYLHGPHGVGKTHLLESIWTAVRAGTSRPRMVYLSSEQFTSYFLQALHGSGLPSFRRKYRDLDLLIIDDVHFFSGKRATIIELLHTVDAVLREGGQLVFSADRAPGELSTLGPELTGRMSGGLVCRMESPDQQARYRIAEEMTRRCEITMPQSVLHYLAANFNGDARLIRGAINQLKAMSEATGQPISTDLAETTLAEMIGSENQAVGLRDIEQAVCEVLGLEKKSLRSARKTKSTSHPRMLAMWLARKYTRAALTEIGQFFGRRSHSTVISAQKNVQRWIHNDTPMVTLERTWLPKDAIKQIESYLKTKCG